jgi:hypothetical protein
LGGNSNINNDGGPRSQNIQSSSNVNVNKSEQSSTNNNNNGPTIKLG